jgi:hypothetical protein
LSFTDFDSSLPQPKTTYYLGTSGKGVEFPVEELNPVDGYAQQILSTLVTTGSVAKA